MLLVASSLFTVGDVRVLHIQISNEKLWRVVPALFFIDILFLDSIE